MMDEPSLKKAKVAPAQDTPIYSSVAMKIMEKMGHKDGQGLGRDGQGISSPVRAREDLKGRAAVRGGGRGVGYGEEKLQPAQKEAVDAALRGDNVFITGPAGTGKSVVLNRIIKHFKLSHRPSGYVAVAPTGPTAISVGGQTIQSFAGCGVPVTPVDFEKCWSRKKDWRALDVMVIEEVSMISGEFFDRLSCVVSAIRKDARPFGGIQLILCGDFLQLPPIPMPIYNVREATKANPDVALHRDRGFVFQSRAWQKAQLTVIQLEKVFRQTNTDFKKVLHEIRFGKVTKEALAFLKQCERPLPDTQSGITATTLYATKRDVRSENDFHLKKLSGPEHVFHASDNINVEFDAPADARDKLWANSFFETCIAEKALKLREGAQVMLIKNEIRKSDLQRLVNGSRGVVVGFTTELTNDDAADYGYPHGEKKYRGYTTRELEREVAFIRPDGSTKRKDKQWCIDNGFKQVSPDVWSGDWHKNYPPDPVYPIVQFKNGRTKTVLPEDFESRIVGLGTCIRTATPLQLAWAITTHKSQGMTLDSVKADVSGVFADAQTYVALSRATDEKSLELRGFSADKVHADIRALAFYENPNGSSPCWDEQWDEAEEAEPSKCSDSKPVAIPTAKAGCLDGLAFVFTGELEGYSRDAAEVLVRSCGGVVRSAVSGKTNCLVIGSLLEDGRPVSSSSKYKRAKSITEGTNKSGLKIITKDGLFSLIHERGNAKGKRQSGLCAFFGAKKK